MRRSPQRPDLAAQQARLADQVIETYVCWREACTAVDRTYAEWCRAGRGDRLLAHAAHLAALEREDCAARTHREAIERMSR
jgi:hypothetical protein